jgi:hypothetical protein
LRNRADPVIRIGNRKGAVSQRTESRTRRHFRKEFQGFCAQNACLSKVLRTFPSEITDEKGTWGSIFPLKPWIA